VLLEVGSGVCDAEHCLPASSGGYCVDDGFSCLTCTLTEGGQCIDADEGSNCSANNVSRLNG
jgi:hypothetical protein